jgi:hypothetical protein
MVDPDGELIVDRQKLKELTQKPQSTQRSQRRSGENAAEKEKGRNRVERSFTRKQVYQIREILQGLFSGRDGQCERSRQVV